MSAPLSSPSPPPPPFNSVAYTVTDSQIQTSCILALISGGAMLALFVLLRGLPIDRLPWFYQKRTEIEDLEARPRKLRLGGWKQMWNFWVPMMAITEEELLQTAGLDVVVLLRTLVFGVQAFLPLAILGCAVLLPVNLHGNTVNQSAADGVSTANSLMYLSIANLPAGSNLYWLVVVFEFLFCFYVVWLLSLHSKSIAILRLQYLMTVRPLREPGDYGVMHLIGPERFERLDGAMWRRVGRVMHELFNPLAMYGWGVASWDRLKASEQWAARRVDGREMSELSTWPTTHNPEAKLQPHSAAVPPAAGSPVGSTPPAMAPWPSGSHAPSQQGLPEPAVQPALSERSACSPAQAVVEHRNGAQLNGGWLARGVSPELHADILQPEAGSFERHRRSWDASHPLLTVTGGEPQGLHPWWLEMQQQPAPLVDDANVLLLGKAIVQRRQLVPAVSGLPGGSGGSQPDVKSNVLQYAVLIQAHTNMESPGHEMAVSCLPWSSVGYVHDPWEGGSAGAAVAEELLAKGRSGAYEQDTCWQRAQADELLQSLASLFPSSFKALVPVYDHKRVDELLVRLDAAMGRVDQEEAQLAGFRHKQWTLWALCCRCRCFRPAKAEGLDAAETDARRANLQRLRQEAREQELKVLEARQEALKAPSGNAFFALFSSQADAHLLAKCSIAMRSWGALWKYTTSPAPASEDVNWQALWTSQGNRQVRRVLFTLPLAAVMIFPMGGIAGTLTNLTAALCPNPESRVYWPWFCEGSGFWWAIAKALLTGLIPMVLSTMWSTFFLPIFFSLIALGQRSCMSLSAVDRLVTRWFVTFCLVNSFLMVVFAGGTFGQLDSWLKGQASSSELLMAVAQAIAGACNYFFNMMVWKMLFTNMIRFVWPHGALFGDVFRLLGIGFPKGPRDVMNIFMAPGFRQGRNIGSIFLVFFPALAYAVINPVILPLALGVFLTWWLTWKWAVLYFYEHSNESGGQMFEEVHRGILTCLYTSAIFTGLSIIARRGWIPGAICLILLPAMLGMAHRFHLAEQHNPDRNYPIEALVRAPAAVTNPLQYVPPGLRNGAVGWYPEVSKMWEKYGVPRYV